MKLWWVILLLSLLLVSPLSSAAGLDDGVADLAKQIVESIGEKNINRVAVIEFTGLNGEINAFGQFLAEELITQVFLAQPGRFEVIERRQLSRVLSEQKLSMSGLVDRDSIAKIGQILGIDALVTGTVTDLGNEIKVNARVISVETGAVFAVGATSIPKVEHVTKLIETLGQPVIGLQTSERAASSNIRRNQNQKSFENDFLRIEYGPLTRSKDRSSLGITLFLENISAEDLYLAVDAKALVINERGDAISLDAVDGLAFVSSSGGKLQKYFSLYHPRMRYPARMVFKHRRGLAIDGEVFSLSIKMLRFHGGKAERFSISAVDFLVE